MRKTWKHSSRQIKRERKKERKSCCVCQKCLGEKEEEDEEQQKWMKNDVFRVSLVFLVS